MDCVGGGEFVASVWMGRSFSLQPIIMICSNKTASFLSFKLYVFALPPPLIIHCCVFREQVMEKSRCFCCWIKWTEIPAALHFRLLWSSENRKRQTEGRPLRAGPQTNRREQAWRKQETLMGRGWREFRNAELWKRERVCVLFLCTCTFWVVLSWI